MDTGIKKAISHSTIYAIGNILRNIVSFIMLPIYTRYLSPADYGVVELLSMIIDFVSIVMGMRIGEAIFRFYQAADTEKDRCLVISNSIWIVMALNGIGVMLLFVSAGPLSTAVFGVPDYVWHIKIFGMTLVMQAIVEVGMTYIRARQRPWHFISLSLIRLILQLSLNIYFVVYLGLRVEGVIYSALGAGLLSSVILAVYVVREVGIEPSFSVMRKMAHFSGPLMLAGVGAFYLTFGDRYFLRIFCDLSTVGIYALGYKFGFLLLYFTWLPFSNIWDSQRYEIMKLQNKEEMYKKMFLLISFAMILGAFCISIFVKDVLRIMSDPQFHSAYTIVPIILIAYMIQSWTAFCNFGILLKGNTIQITYATIVSVIVITIGYFALIPSFGGYGAAWATVLGFLVRFIWVDWQARKGYDMHLPWAKVIALLAWATALYGISILSPENLLGSFVFRLLLVVLFLVGALMSPLLTQEERYKVLAVVRNPAALKRQS